MLKKRIIALACAVLMMASVLASCKNNSSNIDLTDGESGVNVTDTSGTNDAPADTPDGTADGTTDPNAPSTPNEPVSVTIVDTQPSYDDVQIVNAESVRSRANISTTYFAADESYFYYVENSSENIYKARIDGTDAPVKLCDDKVSTVDIAGGNKLDYTTNMEEGMDSNSFTINKDGTGKVDNNELLLDYFGPTEYEKDGKIYANLGMNEGLDKDGIYVRNKDQKESEATLLVEGYVESFCLVDDYIVMCLSATDGYAVYRTDLNGENMVKLFTAQAYRLTVVGNTIYFINQSDSDYIHQIGVDAVKSAK